MPGAPSATDAAFALLRPLLPALTWNGRVASSPRARWDVSPVRFPTTLCRRHHWLSACGTPSGQASRSRRPCAVGKVPWSLSVSAQAKTRVQHRLGLRCPWPCPGKVPRLGPPSASAPAELLPGLLEAGLGQNRLGRGGGKDQTFPGTEHSVSSTATPTEV